MLGGGVPVICRLGAFSKMWLTVDLNPGRAPGLGSDTGTIIPRIMPRDLDNTLQCWYSSAYSGGRDSTRVASALSQRALAPARLMPNVE